MTDDSFATTPRIPGRPFEKHIGEHNLLKRDKHGNVTLFFGYFSPNQIIARKQFSKTAFENYKKNSHMVELQEMKNSDCAQ